MTVEEFNIIMTEVSMSQPADLSAFVEYESEFHYATTSALENFPIATAALHMFATGLEFGMLASRRGWIKNGQGHIVKELDGNQPQPSESVADLPEKSL